MCLCHSTAGESPFGNMCTLFSVSLNCAVFTTDLSLLGDVHSTVVICGEGGSNNDNQHNPIYSPLPNTSFI